MSGVALLWPCLTFNSLDGWVRGAGNPPTVNLLPKKRKTEERGKRGFKYPRILRMGCLNVRGCNEEQKKCEIEEIMNKRDLDVFALNETKLRGKGEEFFGRRLGYKSGVNRGRAREGVGIIVKDELMRCIEDKCFVSSRIMWVRLRFGRERWVFISAHGPGMEKDEK